MRRDDVALVFLGLGDEGLFPVEIHDLAPFGLARTKSEGEVADGVIAGEGLIEEAEILLAAADTLACLVHRDEDGLEVLDEHEEVVDWGERFLEVVAHRPDTFNKLVVDSFVYSWTFLPVNKYVK